MSHLYFSTETIGTNFYFLKTPMCADALPQLELRGPWSLINAPTYAGPQNKARPLP